MDNKHLDDMFKSLSDKEDKYNNAEKQWKIVSKRLKEDKKKKLIIWLAGLTCILGTMIFAYNTTNLNQQNIPETTTIIPTKQITSLEKEKHSIPETPKTLIETQSSNNITTSNNKKEVTSSTSLTIEKRFSLNQEEEELCNCPDDFNIKSLTPQPSIDLYPKAKPSLTLSPILETEKNKTAKNQDTSLTDSSRFVQKIKPLPRKIFECIYKPALSNIWVKNNDNFYRNSITTIHKSSSHFYISTGYLKDIYKSRFLDSTSVAPYFAAGISLTEKWNIEMRYNQHQTKRTFVNGFEEYNLVNTYGLPQDSQISKGTANYKEQTLDIGISYQLMNYKAIRTSLLGGIQIDRQNTGSLALIIENIYSAEPQVFDLEAQALGLRKSYLGLELGIPILSRLEMELQYKRIFSLQSTGINWGNYHRLSLGLNYNLKFKS